MGDLRSELAKPSGRLQLYYRPQVDLATNHVDSVEALLRWNHAKQGFVSPELIIRMAELSGVIGELTGWVMEQALTDCADWQNAGTHIHARGPAQTLADCQAFRP